MRVMQQNHHFTRLAPGVLFGTEPLGVAPRLILLNPASIGIKTPLQEPVPDNPFPVGSSTLLNPFLALLEVFVEKMAASSPERPSSNLSPMATSYIHAQEVLPLA